MSSTDNMERPSVKLLVSEGTNQLHQVEHVMSDGKSRETL